MQYLLDTSIYSQPLKKEPVPQVVKRWIAVGDSNCCISVFCEMELLQGINLTQSNKLESLYHTILKGRIPLIDFTAKEAEVYAELQARSIKQGRKRPVIDLCIAATALTHSCTLVTLNGKDFSDIPGLIVADWGEA
ncbi:MAG: type II toxin-antitoxin system VapC family toxin [Spirochaetaceae bacterium]|nr:type II toxin-antitoxin system VapC family toxin [Spirochaetaceae bacterium]